MVNLPVCINGTTTITESGFVEIKFTDGDGMPVSFAKTPSVTVTPEAQSTDVEKQKFEFEPIKLGKKVSEKLSQLSKAQIQLPELRDLGHDALFKSTRRTTRTIRDPRTGQNKTISATAANNYGVTVPQLDVEALSGLLPSISLPSIDVSKITSQLALSPISDIALPPGMTIQTRTSSREGLKEKAQDSLGNWVFSKGFTVKIPRIYKKDFNLEFNLNGYRDNVADAISYAGIAVVGLVDGKLGEMFDDEFKDYMKDNLADEINPKIESLTDGIEGAANTIVGFINDKVIEPVNENLEALAEELEEIFGGYNDALTGIMGTDTDGNSIPDTGVNALAAEVIRQINGVFGKFGDSLSEEFKQIRDVFNNSFGGLERGINEIIKNIENTMNAKFVAVSDAIQEAIDDINDQLNKAITAPASNLYANLNIPTNLSIAPAPVRKVTNSSFQVYSNGTPDNPLTINWVAVGMGSSEPSDATSDTPTTSPLRGGVIGDLLDKFT